MNLSQRSTVFLDAMGVGPQWLLRARGAAQAVEEVIDEEAQAAVMPETAPVQEAPVAPPAPAAPSTETAWFDNAPPAPSTAPALKQPAKKVTPVQRDAPPPAEDTSWFDAVPAAAPPA
ncbi:hypothetical protein GM672_27725, partial [Massilia buxea]|nr:hypothetical protein [Pseudoduganella buxea]